MNKQELIDHCKTLKEDKNKFINCIDVDRIINTIKQLDEPKPVKVPQFVADWIEEARKTCKDVADFFDFDFTNEEVSKWFMQEQPFDLVARAWLDGYEVEKERKYIVTLKSSGQKLYYHTEDEDYIFSSYDGVFYSGYHTKTDLEENDMSWVFDCPGIDVEEVD
mgnify:CR=1 FL=1